MVPNVEFHIFTIHFESPKRGQRLYKGQDVWSQGVLYNYGVFSVHVHNNCHITCDN